MRYALLAVWYTAFHESSIFGSPVLRAQYYVHPEDEKGFEIDDQFYFASTGMLVKAVTTEGAKEVKIYLADDENYFDYFDYTVYQGPGKWHTVPAPISKIPILMQAGHIIPRKERPRKSSSFMKWDPYTLVVVLDKRGEAEGILYLDHGETFDHELGAYSWRRFKMSGGQLTSEDIGGTGPKTTSFLGSLMKIKIERIVIVNAPVSWKTHAHVRASQASTDFEGSAEVTYHESHDRIAAWAVIKNPRVSIVADWIVDFSEKNHESSDARAEL